ncbi:TetR/AcrR family transcriptional regulator [Nocardia sp. CA-136227]|uniref:TetR/AcrR family transcriptional regulator n=1 Tax=Nocardia sp. CA-136227 TaxID=3239979 RepID=UPI003D97D763
MTTADRVYGGASTSDRRERRRAQLIDAALDIWSAQGWAGVSVRASITRAGLSERYFYESFSNRDELLIAAYDLAATTIFEATARAVEHSTSTATADLIHDMMAAGFQAAAEDPRRTRVVLSDPSGNAALLERRRHIYTRFEQLIATLVEQHMPDGRTGTVLAAAVIFYTGGLAELMRAWVNGEWQVPPDVAIDLGATLLTSALVN